MKALVIEKPGGYERLKIVTRNVHPKPKPHEVLVRVKAAGVNYADCIIRWGLYKSAKLYEGYPITPGFEFAGVVETVGSEVTGFAASDEVMGVRRFGAQASLVTCDQDFLVKKPKSFSFAQAGTFPAVYLTAYHALYQNFIARKGMKTLIHSAAGGVGGALLQLGRILSLEMTGVVGHSAKIETAKKLGAQHIIDKSAEDLWQKAETFAPDGYDIICDANGVSTLKQSYNHLAPMGKLVVYGFHSMFPKRGGYLNFVKLATSFLRTPRFSPFELTETNKSIVGFNLSFLFAHKPLFQEAMTDLIRFVEEGKLAAPPVKSYPLSEVARAHSDLESGKTVGKLCLCP